MNSVFDVPWDMGINLILNHNFILFKNINNVLAVVRNNVFLEYKKFFLINGALGSCQTEIFFHSNICYTMQMIFCFPLLYVIPFLCFHISTKPPKLHA